MAEEKFENSRDPMEDLANEGTGTEETGSGRDPIDNLVEEITGNLNWDDPAWQNAMNDWQSDGFPWEKSASSAPKQEDPKVDQPPQGEKTPVTAGTDNPPPHPPAKRKRKSLPDNIAESIIYAGGILLISFIIATVGWRWANDVLALNKTPTTASVTVEEGDSIGDIADQLKEKGLIRYKYLFQLFAGVTGKTEKITAGSYELSTEMDYSALLNNIGSTSAYRETVTVTIPEGYTVEEVFQLMDDKGVCDYDSLMDSAKTDQFNYDFLAGVKAEGAERLEGYLFPDTYEFYKGTTAKSAISKMLYNFSTRFDEKMEAEMQLLGYSKNEIIIIASIIEKETDGSDQRDIASVLYNRLENTWASPRGYLQVDSTIQYLLEERKETLTQADLDIDSPYNTYLYPGLPVGAICNPGLTAIEAALDPHDTNYYYFMLGNDGRTHFFESEYSFQSYKAEQAAARENDQTGDTTTE